MPRLSVTDLALSFGGVQCLVSVSMAVEPGSIVGLIGPNGAGKTSLFNCVSRLYEPQGGSIRFGSRDLLAKRPDEISGAGIARTFQNLGLLRGQTVLENVMLGAYRRTRSGLVASALGLRRVGREETRERERAEYLLGLLGLRPFARSSISGLPFGVLKRVELVRALMLEPQLLMLDEPANGLMYEEVEALSGQIRELSSVLGFSVLLVEHNMGLVSSICDHVVVLNSGSVICEGAPEEVQTDPAVVAAYLGAPS